MLIKCGQIDCLHSYGDLATTRGQAARALEELERHGCRLRVWVDHSKAPTNFGADIMQGHGDEPGHPAYHADLTLAYGIKYVWRGRVTSVIGQNQPWSLRGIADQRHPLASAKTVLTEAAKQILARCGVLKYRMHAANRLMRPIQLRDGHGQIYEFMRCNPHWAGVSGRDTGQGIGEVLSERFLDRLTARRGACILYTHLGKLGRGSRRFDARTVRAFERLAERQRQGRILVTTTSKLLARLETFKSPAAGSTFGATAGLANGKSDLRSPAASELLPCQGETSLRRC